MIEIFYPALRQMTSSPAQASTALLKQQTLVAAKMDKCQNKNTILEKELGQQKREYETLKNQYRTLLKTQSAQQAKHEKLEEQYQNYRQETEKQLKAGNIKLKELQKAN